MFIVGCDYHPSFHCERAAGFCADVCHTDPAYLDALVRMLGKRSKPRPHYHATSKPAFSAGSIKVRNIGRQIGYG